MTDLSRDDVIAALGPIDDEVIEDLIATGITPVQLAEARVWVAMDRVLTEVGADRRHPVGEVGRAVAILQQLVDANVPLAPEPHHGSDSFPQSVQEQGPAAPVILSIRARRA